MLDVAPFRYQKFISDIAGQDIYAHGGSEQRAIQIVRDWLRLQLDPQTRLIPSGSKIFERYQDFQHDLPVLCDQLQWNPHELQFADFSYAVASWIASNPL